MLKVFSYELSEEQLLEIRQLLAKYFAQKVDEEMDSLWKEKGWTEETMREWANEHLHDRHFSALKPDGFPPVQIVRVEEFMEMLSKLVVYSIIFDEKMQRATGVRVVDSESKQMTEFYAEVIFCCASTLATTQILLNSVSARFPNGMGNDSGELCHTGVYPQTYERLKVRY